MQTFGLVIVLLLLVLVYLMTSGEGLKCYVCRSDMDSHCTSQDILKNYSVTCPKLGDKDAVVCRKITQKLKFKEDDDGTSIRECGYHVGHLKCYFYDKSGIATQETCECKEDDCNRGRSFRSDVMVIVFMFVFVTAHYYLYTI